MRPTVPVLALTLLLTVPAWANVRVELRGSPASMSRQNQYARAQGYAFARSMDDVRRLVDEGALVPLEGNDDYDLRPGMMAPFARPEMRLFVERFAAQYHAATGEKLVVTSLTRPSTMQPRNASRLSVHPTGMAVDLRMSQRAASRQYLERSLLSMEASGLLDITRENNPPHYHVALFTAPYLEHVERLIGPDSLAIALGHVFEEDEEEYFFEAAEMQRPDEVSLEPEGRRSIWRVLLGLIFRLPA
jgi:hypothetical protein